MKSFLPCCILLLAIVTYSCAESPAEDCVHQTAEHAFYFLREVRGDSEKALAMMPDQQKSKNRDAVVLIENFIREIAIIQSIFGQMRDISGEPYQQNIKKANGLLMGRIAKLGAYVEQIRNTKFHSFLALVESVYMDVQVLPSEISKCFRN